MRLADIEVPNSPIDRDSKGEAACYPQRTFYSLSIALPHRTVGSLRPAFAPARPVRLAVKPPSANARVRVISIHPEGTIGRLRYLLGGDRPSQTAHLTLSPTRVTGAG